MDPQPSSILHAHVIPVGLRRVLIVSVGIHVIVVIALMLGQLLATSDRPGPRTVLTTKLVRLGKERPKKLLPRKQPPPTPAPAVAVAPVERPNPAVVAQPSSSPTVSAKDRIAQMTQKSRALDRLKRKYQEQEGSPDGSPDGELSSLQKSILGNKYATEIYRCIKQHYNVEGLDRSQVAGLQATVLVRVDASGRFIEDRMLEPSTRKRFDRAVRRAIKRCAKVSPPPAGIRTQVQDGVEIVFTP